MSARGVRMSKIKNGGLDQYGTEPFEQQQFGTVGTEGVNKTNKTSELMKINVCASQHKTSVTVN